jgi:hypothetical protein
MNGNISCLKVEMYDHFAHYTIFEHLVSYFVLMRMYMFRWNIHNLTRIRHVPSTRSNSVHTKKFDCMKQVQAWPRQITTNTYCKHGTPTGFQAYKCDNLLQSDWNQISYFLPLLISRCMGDLRKPNYRSYAS